jgi:hypothetical protein
MQTLTIDILNQKALKLLKDLENLQLIRVRRKASSTTSKTKLSDKYKGIISKEQGLNLDEHIKEMRNEWSSI